MTSPWHSMRLLRVLGVGMLVAGIVAIIAGALTGDIQVGLAFFFIPYLSSSSALGALAILLVFGGIAVMMLDAVSSWGRMGPAGDEERTREPDGGPKKEFGGVVLIGPLPIVFGSSSRAALLALVAGALLLMAMLIALFLL